ncbi:MAG: cobalt ECF transporter T component CbiQ [Actinobacteria bacterium]|nr:cobalt ECF transporter T component CbiQ [Actinomycetota bacterium]
MKVYVNGKLIKERDITGTVLGSDHAPHDDGIHLHDHEHENVVHRHIHYHPPAQGRDHDDIEKGHQHTHTYSFEVYAYANSPIHRLDARTKTIAFIALILAMVVMPLSEIWRFGLFAFVIASLYVISGIPLLFGLKRSLIVIPFVLFAGIFLIFMPDKPHPTAYNFGFASFNISHGGLYMLFNALVKSWFSVLTAILLYSTTPFPKFIKGLELLRTPRVITMLFSFLYRFMWVLADEVKRMIRARDARAFGGGRVWHLQVIGQMVGSLFIRSFERAERVYAAMLARGYDGAIRTLDTLTLTWRDGLFSALFFTVFLTILFWRI